MTDQTTSAAPAISHNIPQQMLDAAHLAIMRGAELVALSFMGPGHTRPVPESWIHAPLGWQLVVRMRDQDSGEIQSVDTLAHKIGWPAENIKLSTRITNRPKALVVNKLVELFFEAVSNGWEASYQRHDDTFRTSDLDLKRLPSHSLIVQYVNWDYDEAARERGEFLLGKATLNMREPEPQPDGSTKQVEPLIAWFDTDGVARPGTVERIEAMIDQPAPHTKRVAFFDRNGDNGYGAWVL